ncbi:MAG: hypothetical protein IJV38_09555 [Prevotella sp.]|nr:hypothetical protein [Prevotella sp.]
MKRLLYIMALIGVLLPATAQTTVRDASDGQPVVQASVYDEQGKIIGVTDADGLLPHVGDSKTIRLTHIAYQPLDVRVGQIGQELRMQPVTYAIKPVVVESKKDAYCLKLMCYYRQYMVNGKGTVDELPPLVSFVDGICNLYLFTDDYKTTRQVQLAKRQVVSNDMESGMTEEELPGISIHSLAERYHESMDKSPYTFQQDSMRHIVTTTFNALYPDKSRPVKLNILDSHSKYRTVAAPTMVKNQHQTVHRMGTYAKVSQGDLLAYSEVRQLKGTMRQRGHEKYAMNLWLFDEYFPVEAELMTKQEYKAEQKTHKAALHSMSPEAIDHYIDEQHIPELSSDIQRKLEMTRKRQQKSKQASAEGNGKNVLQERIYLQTDKPYYAAGDTVWFRAHLMDAATNVPVSRSRFVYVELHDQEADTLCQRLMVKADEDGVFANALLLPKTMKSGVYTLAAYTQWMRNFPAERFCYQPLTVAGGQRVRGHRIPLQHLSQHGAKVKVSGKAATENSPMTLDLSIQDQDGLPLSGTFALSVTDYDVVKPDSLFGDIRQSLLRQQYADTPDSAVTITYPFQEQQFITGSVKGSLGQHIKQPHLLVVNSRTGHREEFELGDSTRFTLAVDNPNGTTFTLEGTRRSGRTSFVKLQIDPLTFPELKLPHYRLATDTAGLATFTAQAQAQQRYSRVGYIELPEVEKVGKKPQMQRRNTMALEAPKGFNVGDPWIERASTVRQLLTRLGINCYIDAWGREHINGEGGNQYVGKVYVDNVEYNIAEEDCDVLNIPPQNISSIEYFPTNYAQNSIFGVRPMPWSGIIPGVLFIFLKDGSEIVHSKAGRPLSMATVQQLGYEQPVEFYSPQYPDPAQKTRPDHRTTLYWNPAVKTDADGHATIHFYTSDVSKRYLITLEGVSDNGTVVHQQQVIE